MTEPRVITAWLNYYNTPAFLDQTRQLAEVFMARHPEYRVEIVGHDWQELPGRVAEAARQGQAPTLAQFFYSATREALDLVDPAGRPLFRPVQRAVAGRREILGEPVVLDDLLPAVRDYYTVDGELTGMPTLASTAVFYVNTTLLEAAGVDTVPQTWQEVETAAKALAAMPDGPEYPASWPNHGWIFQQSLAQQGGMLADRDNGRSGPAQRVDLCSPELMAYVRFWQQLHRSGGFLYTGDTDPSTCWGGTFEAFATQRVAMTISSSVAAPYMVETGRAAGFTVVAAPLPHNGDVPCAGTLIGGDSVWLRAGLDPAVEDGALAFLQFLDNPRNAADRHKVSGYLPVTRPAADLLTAEGWFAQHPHLRVGLDQLDASDRSAAVRGALIGDLTGIQAAAVAAMHDVLVDGVDPAARFALASAQAQQLVDAYRTQCHGTGAVRRSPDCVRVA
ncbi:extracellular solute-binding protein [Micromonospora gifhornensis]|uniref:extracellular solute-binding protein n=1 Tax=Micromonospora gifhornensis TaxID=84594 RepID=UPI003665EA2B